MKILHYSLGFPPYRSGGMTKFCIDLIKEQIKEGHNVSLLWPGRIGFFLKTTAIRNKGMVKSSGCNIQSFEVINPIPVPLDEGIRETSLFFGEGNSEIFSDFLSKLHPDIIHIHTFMGLHFSLLREAKKMGIRLVFTAHDFFPFCPKVTLFRGSDVCCVADTCSECPDCNRSALDIKKIILLQSPLYRKIKNIGIIKKFRKQHRDRFLVNEQLTTDLRGGDNSKEYAGLREYYKSMLDLMDCIHFNSNLTRTIYDRFFEIKKGCTIYISHGNIFDNRKIKEYFGDVIRYRYMGPYGKAKGFIQLKNALDKLWEIRQDFTLDIHFDPPEKAPYIRVNNRYSYNDLEELYFNTDACIIPSVCYETFGFVVLEALSFGVPVIVTKRVGAGEIIVPGAGIVVDNSDNNGLFETLKNMDREKLSEMNRAIVAEQTITGMKDVSEKIVSNCYSL